MNDKINGFTFYSNYYEFYKNLQDKDRLKLMDSILNYMFENKEPNNLDGMLKAIWTNIKMPLNNSKTNIENGKKGGAPKGNKNAQKNNRKTTEDTTKKQANNISTFLFLISNINYKNINNNNLLKSKIEEWLKYKEERKEIYKETGLKNLLTQIEKKVEEYGSESVIEVIIECMASNYKGIIFDKLKSKNTSPKEEKIERRTF